jgi:predicted AlkP superfamily phosphohydrolase/phosphomutase
MQFFRRKKKPKVFILGLDGVPCSLLQRFVQEGIMPNLSRVIETGTLLDMDASLPEVSSTSWATFMTGVNPARHGIYGFMDLEPGSYRFYFPNFHHIKSNTFWDILGREGKRSIVLNIPSTYPAKPLNGILTAGFVAIDLQKATYPQSAYEYLKSIDYRMDVEAEKATESLEALAEDIDYTFKKRKEAFLHFLRTESWDLFVASITETDRLHHFLWTALENNNHPLHSFFINFYRQLDGLIADFSEIVGRDTGFFIVSDHGFTGIKHEIYLNTYLRQKGYLHFKKEPPDSLEDLAPDTKAFVLDPSRVYINLKDKYPSGIVSPGKDYYHLREEIREELLNLVIEGEKVVKEIFYKEDIYNGPYLNYAPDLVILANNGFDLKGSLNKKDLTGRSIFTGAHTRNNAIFFANQKIDPNQPINIIDVAPTILNFMGVNPSYLDGHTFI